MQTCGLENWEELHELVKKRYLSGSGTCKGTPYEERKRK